METEAVQLFENYAEVWDRYYKENIFYGDRNHVLERWLADRKFMNYKKGVTALEIGCGTAQASRAYSALGFKYFGVDIAYPMLGKARQKMGVNAILIDGEQIPLKDNSVDVSHMFNVIEFVRQPKALLGEVCRVLKPESLFLMTITNFQAIHEQAARWKCRLTGRPYGIAQILNRYRFDSIKQILKQCGFGHINMYTYGLSNLINSLEYKWFYRFTRNIMLGSSVYIECRKIKP